MITRLPLFVRKFLVDFVETGAGSALALNGGTLIFNAYGLPAGVDEWSLLAASVCAGFIGAAVSAARRAFPDFKVWLRGVFGLPA